MVAIATTEPRLNNDIRTRECRLIGADGTQLGIFGIGAAKNIADEQGLDLVEIAPGAEPPVCRVMDYSKYRYEQTQKAKLARKKQARVEVKEMKFRPKIDVGDYETKKRHILRFLQGGAKVKVTIMFRGREMAHPDIGLDILKRLADDLKEAASIENQPKLEGRNMFMLIAPLKKHEEKGGRQDTSNSAAAASGGSRASASSATSASEGTAPASADTAVSLNAQS
ncbi:MAG: translation initiation factor IF-3 [Coriobacteriales bacterium]|nr:translation initiation factor IF-3 [Coriobacteriales bacterium]